MTTKRIAYCAMLTALAMIFGYVEALFPFSFGIPGMKLGLANLVIVTALYLLPAYQVFCIQVARIVLISFLFGNMSMMLYSIAGGVLSFFVMYVLKYRTGYSIIGVSVAGGVSHNIGQLLVACIVVENSKVILYLPILLIAGVVTGALIGIVAQRIRSTVKKVRL